jgi:hypothetical protein
MKKSNKINNQTIVKVMSQSFLQLSQRSLLTIPVLCQGVPQNTIMRNDTVRPSLLDIVQTPVNFWNLEMDSFPGDVRAPSQSPELSVPMNDVEDK